MDERVQVIANEALENGLGLYEERHPKAKGLIQGSVVVLRNRDAAILAEVGGREVFQGRWRAYPDFNRATESMRQPGWAWKPILYLAAFRLGMGLDSPVPDDSIAVPTGDEGGEKWIANYDGRFKGPISVRQALAESRNAPAIWLGAEIGLEEMIRVARELGIRSPLHPLPSALSRRDFPVPVMGKTGTTNDFRDALFVGSTYGPEGVTVAVRIGFDDNRSMGANETGGRTALPIFREIMLRMYGENLVGPAPEFPREIERGINGYLAAAQAAAQAGASGSAAGHQRF